jgi:hypothetical protein
VDYIHSSTLKVPLLIDVNHVGAARFLNKAAAQAAIAATADAFGCSGGFSAAAINCAINNGATIIDFASNGLDAANQLTGGISSQAAGTPMAAFGGANPNVGQGFFILPVGRSGYDALQIVLKQQVVHPMRGIQNSVFQISYSLSKIVNPLSSSNGNTGDQFFSSYAWDNDDPNQFMGRPNLDHTNQISFGGTLAVKYGLNVGMTGHFFSAQATSLSLDNLAGDPGEIFRTDVTGDGTTGDVVPGTLPGDYMHSVKGASLNKLIGNYNATHAGQLTPAGQALVNASLFTPGQLSALNAVQQKIATAPSTPLNNPAFRSFDANVSYPIKLNRLREGMSIEPTVAMYNVFNMGNFGTLAGTLANVNTAGGNVGTANNYLNGPNNVAIQNGLRTQRGSGTFSSGAPRTTEFQLKFNF